MSAVVVVAGYPAVRCATGGIEMSAKSYALTTCEWPLSQAILLEGQNDPKLIIN